MREKAPLPYVTPEDRSASVPADRHSSLITIAITDSFAVLLRSATPLFLKKFVLLIFLYYFSKKQLLASTETYRILGVDPGTNILGFAVIEIRQKEISLLEMGVIHLHKLDDPHKKLKRIFTRLQTIIDNYRPREMAVEAPFFGKNVQSMLKLGRAQGVAMAAAITKDVQITEYSPKKIKQSVTGNGNAAKEQVAAMLSNILRVDFGDHYLDASDALAAAVCHYYQSQSPLNGRRKYNDWSGFLKDNPDRLG